MQQVLVERQRDTAIWAIARFAAIAAQQGCGESAAIQKQNRLLTFLETMGDGLRQFLRENGGFLFFASLLAQINHAHERHLFLVHTLRECNEPVLSDRRVMITLQRRRGAPENDNGLLNLCAHDCDVACVIPRCLLLFVCRFVFFIDHDESQILQRGEHCAARADYDPGASGMNFVPFIMALALG